MEMGGEMTEFYICIDCAMWHANADLTGLDDETREAKIKACTENLVIDCGENEEYCVDFGKAPCDACGSHLAGTRHRAFAI